jgi:hypothetical protein
MRIRTMKPLFVVATVLLLSTSRLFAQAVEYIDADKWVVQLEFVSSWSVLGLAGEYDEALVRDWIVNYWVDRETPENLRRNIDLKNKLQALAAYGEKKDLGLLNQVADELQNLRLNDPALPLYQSVFLARNGDRRAMKELLEVPSEIAVLVLPYCRNEEASNKLATIARNVGEKPANRTEALWALCMLGDNRGVQIALTSEFIGAVTAVGGDMEALLARITGFHELLGTTDPDKAWAIIKEKNLTLLPAKKKSVKGPIDWSKYRVKAGLPSLPATSERSPLPKRFRQPKPEKPDTAAAPTQKPPASNTGRLIAAGAAIVGLLAVLIWFLRKK